MRRQQVVEGFQDFADAQVLDAAERDREVAPEIAQHLFPVDLAGRDPVELLLEIGGEAIFDIAGKERFEEGGDQPALVLGNELLALLADIAALPEHGQDRRIGRGPADPQLLHLLDQRGFGIAGRRLGGMLLAGERRNAQPIAARDLRQAARILVLLVVAALLIELEEAVEADDRAGGAEDVALAVAPRRDGIDGGALDIGAFHLARHGPLPDQLVELGLVAVENPARLIGMAEQVGRADRLMGLLGVLGLGAILPRDAGHIGLAKAALDDVARRGDGLRRHLHPVGAHIGDEAGDLAIDLDALVQPLRHLHGAGGGKAELAGSLLLQRRGGEGGRRMTLGRTAFDRGDGEDGAGERCLDGAGRCLVGYVELAEPRAGDGVEARLELLAIAGSEGRLDGPIFLAAEGFDLELAVADEAQRHRLHPAGRAGSRQLAPQHRRQREADQVIERPPGEIGLHQRGIDLARMAHRLLHRLPGDGVEHDPLHRLALDHAAAVEELENMPGDRLALAIRIGGEDQPLRGLEGGCDLGDPLGRPAVGLPVHGEIFIGSHRAVLGRQVADMAVGGKNSEALAEVFVDGFRLGRRFDDDNIHGEGFRQRGRLIEDRLDDGKPYLSTSNNQTLQLLVSSKRVSIRSP